MAQREHRGGVLVVGGGYAGLHAVRAAEQLGVDVAVIDRTPTMISSGGWVLDLGGPCAYLTTDH